jgi:hypothetical protein
MKTPPGLGHADFRLIHRRDAMAEGGQMHGVAAFTLGQTQNRPGGNLRRHLRDKFIRRFAIDMMSGGVTVIPKGCVHVCCGGFLQA